MNALMAITWEPELRGILIVIIAFVTLCGSIYLVLATNLGARLGFLVAFTGLAGWMALMGSVWWIYGIGLKGPEPSWEAMPGTDRDPGHRPRCAAPACSTTLPDDSRGCVVRARRPSSSTQQFVDEGWVQLEESEPSFGQAGSAAGELLVETDTFANGEFKVERVFDTGASAPRRSTRASISSPSSTDPTTRSSRSPRSSSSSAEPGRAPTPPEIDTTRQRQYVYMVRDLGARRQPAALITLGSIDRVLVALLDAAPARPGRRREPQPTTGAGGLTRWASTCRSRHCSFSPSCSAP